MRVLVVRFSSIGDIVLTTPVIRCLKNQLSGLELHYASKKAYASLLETNPHIDQLHLLDQDWGVFVDSLRRFEFDYIIDLHHNLKSLRLSRALKSKRLAFNKKNLEKWALVNFKLDLLPDVHIVDRYMDTVSSLGVNNDFAGLDYYFPSAFDTASVPQNILPPSHQSGFNALVIGAKYATKQLTTEKVIQIAQGSKQPTVLIGGPEDASRGADIAAKVGEKCFNACGKCSLHDSAALIKAARKIVSNDTGLMHIAAAFQKPICSVWGNTVPKLGMYPYLGSAQPLDKYKVTGQINELSLPCRPCSKIGFDSCPKGHFKCMKDQEVAEILTWLNT